MKSAQNTRFFWPENGPAPPEDIGGIPGYEHFLEAINYPLSEEHAELLNWYGSKTFDPDFF